MQGAHTPDRCFKSFRAAKKGMQRLRLWSLVETTKWPGALGTTELWYVVLMIRSITYVASTRRLGTFHITGAAPLSFERAWLWTSWSCFASWDSHNYFIAGEDIHGARKWNCIILKIAIPQSGRSEFDNLFVYFAFHAHGPTWMLEGCFCSTSSMFVCMLRSLVQILTALEFILQDFPESS